MCEGLFYALTRSSEPFSRRKGFVGTAKKGTFSAAKSGARRLINAAPRKVSRANLSLRIAFSFCNTQSIASKRHLHGEKHYLRETLRPDSLDFVLF